MVLRTCQNDKIYLMSNERIFLYIIWSNALYKYDQIYKDLKNHFNILNVFKVKWSNDNWVSNIQRFYSINKPDALGKISVCGNGDFVLIVVEEKDNPIYEYRDTPKGKRLVNSHVFDLKQKYRELTGRDHKIHASNSSLETNRDLTILLGVNLNDYLTTYTHNEKIIHFEKDTYGLSGFNNLDDLFYYMNNTENYVIIRDFDENLYKVVGNTNLDIDILTDDKKKFAYTLGVEKNDGSSKLVVCVNNKELIIDAKDYGDDYYDMKMMRDMVDSRILMNNYYVLDNNNYYYSLLYHAILHKDNFEEQYNDRLASLFFFHNNSRDIQFYIGKLQIWLKKNGYKISNYKKINIKNVLKFDQSLLCEKLIERIKHE